MEVDLFVPSDMHALLAVKAAIAGRTMSPEEVRAMFESHGLIRRAKPHQATTELRRNTSLGRRDAA